tara:strand:- start:2200 stop:2442 length:243 start_codon:yes stop_codon:yes gene_type:complete
MAKKIVESIRIIRRKQLEDKTGLSRSGIYAKLKPNPKRPNDYDPSFPQPISVGAKAVGWIESEVESWLEGRIKASRNVGC